MKTIIFGTIIDDNRKHIFNQKLLSIQTLALVSRQSRYFSVQVDHIAKLSLTVPKHR
jgi:hypothetical protein